MFELLSRYIPNTISPEHQVNNFIREEHRLSFTSLLLAEFPQSEIYLVGGTVRDVLLGKIPNDIDIVVKGVESEELDKWLKKQGAADFVGRFGTWKFIPHGFAGQEPIDIALPRTEFIGEHHASGRADQEVKFNPFLSIEKDLARRDFTVNAIAYSFRSGRLIDPFFGLKDLRHRIIQAVLIPEERFFEDATRMLRALRLASQLHFGIESQTWQAIQNQIKLLNSTHTTDEGESRFSVPREAIGREFLLGFYHHPIHTLELWADSGALHLFMPELILLEGTDEVHAERLSATKKLLHLLHQPTLRQRLNIKKLRMTTLLAGLFAFTDIESGHARKICTNLYFHQFPSTHHAHTDCEELYWLLDNSHIFENKSPNEFTPAEFEKLFMNERGAELLFFLHAKLTAAHDFGIQKERLHDAERIRSKFFDVYKAAGDGNHLPKLLSGSDLQALGLNPGPKFREIFDFVRNKQLTGEITDKETAIETVKREFIHH